MIRRFTSTQTFPPPAGANQTNPVGSRHSGSRMIPFLALCHQQILLTSCRESVRKGLSRQSRNQTGKFGHIESSAVRVILDDPPIHIHPDIPAARGCKPNEPCGFTPFRLTHDSILGALPPASFAHKLSRVSS